jgi:hypothetical protein
VALLQKQEAEMAGSKRMRAEDTGSFSRRRLAKVAVAALGIAAVGGAGVSGVLAKHGSDDDWVFGGSGGSGGSGFDDDGIFFPSGGSGGSGGSGWDDDWDDWFDD